MDATKFASGSKRYKAAQLDGQDLRLIISHVDAEELTKDNGQTDEKLVLFFKGDDLSLPLNVTNTKAMIKRYGKDTLDWCSKPVFLHPTTCEFGSKTVECIRLKFPPVKPTAAVASATVEQPVGVSASDEIQF